MTNEKKTVFAFSVLDWNWLTMEALAGNINEKKISFAFEDSSY